MNRNQHYFTQREKSVSNRFFSASGAEGWNASGNGWNASAPPAAIMQIAPMPQMAPAVHAEPAPPLIINVTNGTTSDISNVTLFDANNVVGNTSTGTLMQSPNWQNPAGVTISSGVTNIDYQQMLVNSQTTPASYRLMRLICSTAAQLTQTMTISIVNPATGDKNTSNYYPDQDEYQTLTNIVSMPLRNTFVLNGMNSIIISVLKASATLTIKLFPNAQFNPSEQHLGVVQRPMPTFGNPNVSRLLAIAR